MPKVAKQRTQRAARVAETATVTKDQASRFQRVANATSTPTTKNRLQSRINAVFRTLRHEHGFFAPSRGFWCCGGCARADLCHLRDGIPRGPPFDTQYHAKYYTTFLTDLKEHPREWSYVFYTLQDFEDDRRDSDHVYLFWGCSNDDEGAMLATGRLVCKALKKAGLRVDWDKTVTNTIAVKMA